MRRAIDGWLGDRFAEAAWTVDGPDDTSILIGYDLPTGVLVLQEFEDGTYDAFARVADPNGLLQADPSPQKLERLKLEALDRLFPRDRPTSAGITIAKLAGELQAESLGRPLNPQVLGELTRAIVRAVSAVPGALPSGWDSEALWYALGGK